MEREEIIPSISLVIRRGHTVQPVRRSPSSTCRAIIVRRYAPALTYRRGAICSLTRVRSQFAFAEDPLSQLDNPPLSTYSSQSLCARRSCAFWSAVRIVSPHSGHVIGVVRWGANSISRLSKSHCEQSTPAAFPPTKITHSRTLSSRGT